jgi:acetyl-CoA acetyltransferase
MTGNQIPDAAIVGLGLTEQGRHLGLSPRELRRRAVDLAIADAGLPRDAIDGYILVGGGGSEDLRYLGLRPGFSFALQSGGASPALAVIAAAGMIATGQAEYIACVYGEAFASEPARLQPNSGAQERFHIGSVSYGYTYLFGMVGPASSYALQARRYMERYGATSKDLGAVAVAGRQHGAARPGSVSYGQPITIEDHQASRMIVDPLRLLDCSRPTDGGAAVIVTSAERAADCAATPVRVLGAGSGHGTGCYWDGTMFEQHSDIPRAARRAFGQAGLGLADVDVAQFYDAFTIAVILQLEQYGFCDPGGGADFVTSGQTRITGSLPVNTGGGQLPGFYATGFTPLSEGILQVRGTAPTNQVEDAEVSLVSGMGGNGGVQGSWPHATLLLGRQR